jgi:exodeoxyribonuclease VII small subunit
MAKKKETLSKELSYELAFHELQDIIASIENDEVSIDALALKVKRAGELVQFCRLKLRAAETEINTLVSQMNDESIVGLE